MSRQKVPPSTIFSSWTPRKAKNKPKDSVSDVLPPTLGCWRGTKHTIQFRCPEAFSTGVLLEAWKSSDYIQ